MTRCYGKLHSCIDYYHADWLAACRGGSRPIASQNVPDLVGNSCRLFVWFTVFDQELWSVRRETAQESCSPVCGFAGVTASG